jgi:hypothetical protein
MVDFRVKGAFFENVKDTGPAFTGFVEIDGVKTQIALWPKTSAKGQNYLQVAEEKKRSGAVAPPKSPFRPRGQQQQAPQQQAPQQQPQGYGPGYNNDLDDEIPPF